MSLRTSVSHEYEHGHEAQIHNGHSEQEMEEVELKPTWAELFFDLVFVVVGKCLRDLISLAFARVQSLTWLRAQIVHNVAAELEESEDLWPTSTVLPASPHKPTTAAIPSQAHTRTCTFVPRQTQVQYVLRVFLVWWLWHMCISWANIAIRLNQGSVSSVCVFAGSTCPARHRTHPQGS